MLDKALNTYLGVIILALGGISVTACEDNFEPYEDIQQPRLLAIAANPPDLVPDATTVLTALLTESATSTRWSWCPLVGSPNDGYPCLVGHDLLQAEVDRALGSGQVTVPPYELGSNDSAELSNVVPAQVWRVICSILQGGELASPLVFSRCEESFPVTIRLEVAFGAREITGIRQVKLHYDAAAIVNTVPVLGSMTATEVDNGAPIALDDLGSAELARDTSYRLEVALADAQSESYLRDPLTGDPLEATREILRLSWFHEGGELDAGATSFNEGSTNLGDARTNEWRTPTTVERADDSSSLFIVLRDDRGGTSWVTSNLRFVR